MVSIMKEGERRQSNEREVRMRSAIQQNKPEAFTVEPEALLKVPLPQIPITTPVSNVNEVIEAILDAKDHNTILRVVGSYHSASDAIFPKEGKTLVLMGDLRKIEFLKEVEENGKTSWRRM